MTYIDESYDGTDDGLSYPVSKIKQMNLCKNIIMFC